MDWHVYLRLIVMGRQTSSIFFRLCTASRLVYIPKVLGSKVRCNYFPLERFYVVFPSIFVLITLHSCKLRYGL